MSQIQALGICILGQQLLEIKIAYAEDNNSLLELKIIQ